MVSSPAQPSSSGSPSTGAIRLFRAAALVTFLAVVMGSVVCATESGAACPTWPGCYPGQVVPGAQLNPIIEFTHRVVAILAGPLLLAAAITGTRIAGAGARVKVLPWIALVCAGLSAVFGRIVVLAHLPLWWGVVDLLCALVAMIAMGIATLSLQNPRARWAPTALSHSAALACGLVILVHLTGILAAGAGSYTRCMGWPMWRILEADPNTTLQIARLILAVLAFGVIARTIQLATTPVPTPSPLRAHAAVLAALVVAELLVGAVILATKLSWASATAYSILAVATLWCLGLLYGRSALRDEAHAEGQHDQRNDNVEDHPRAGAGKHS